MPGRELGQLRLVDDRERAERLGVIAVGVLDLHVPHARGEHAAARDRRRSPSGAAPRMSSCVTRKLISDWLFHLQQRLAVHEDQLAVSSAALVESFSGSPL